MRDFFAWLPIGGTSGMPIGPGTILSTFGAASATLAYSVLSSARCTEAGRSFSSSRMIGLVVKVPHHSHLMLFAYGSFPPCRYRPMEGADFGRVRLLFASGVQLVTPLFGLQGEAVEVASAADWEVVSSFFGIFVSCGRPPITIVM